VASVKRSIPIVLATLVLAWASVFGIYRKLSHAGAPLDDAFIHFQYARAWAELHPFRFQAGEPMTTGATSLLWPALLAPFHALGARDVRILWPAWAMSFAALGLLAHEAKELTRPLAGAAAAVGAGAMILAFSAFAWCAASGMEVVPFAWLLARAARRSSDWVEARRQSPATPPSLRELAILAVLLPLMRPEGAIGSWMIGLAVLAFPPAVATKGRPRLIVALVALASPLFPFALGYVLTGEVRSSTATVKLMLGNPYYGSRVLWASIAYNLRLLFGTLLNGEVWSAEFVPRGGAGFAVAGLVAVVIRGWQSRRPWRATCVLVLALAMMIPCTYITFLWNRLRYLWPFATGWLIGLACLARVFGGALGWVHDRWRVATPILCGAFVGVFLTKMAWTLDDVADSASGIDRQQVLLGRWAKENLPAGARIGVNDTGAIAYLSDRHTFDIVGLTTKGEGRYWVAGAASRFEHYERLWKSSPERLPTHYIVYPGWMACDVVLGPELYEATVTDATILGGTTMRVYEADYALLGSGERPWTPMGDLVDVLDVADLESEADHSYDLAGTYDQEEVLRDSAAPDGKAVVDGGRGGRVFEHFLVTTHGRATRGVVRIESAEPAQVKVVWAGQPVGQLDLPGSGEWTEQSFPLSARPSEEPRTPLELRVTGGPVTVYHYWFD
jgi:hypothetical protein